MGKLIIEGGLVATPSAGVVADLLIENGLIAALAAPSTRRRGSMLVGADEGASAVFDALGRFVLPAATMLLVPPPQPGQAAAAVPRRSGSLPRSSSVACWLRDTQTPAPAGNWLPIWYPSPDALEPEEIDTALAEQVWGGGVPVVGLRASQPWRGGDRERWLAALGALAAAAGALVVLWLAVTTPQRQVVRVAERVVAAGGRLLLAVDDAAQASGACALAASIGGAAAGVWVASPFPDTAGAVAASSEHSQRWWELVRTGAVTCLSGDGSEGHLLVRLYRDGVASGRIGLTHLASLVAGWLRRHAGLSPPLTPDSEADVVVVDPESTEPSQAERVWVDGAPVAAAAGRRVRGRPLPWPH